jgi:hypothetical protein
MSITLILSLIGALSGSLGQFLSTEGVISGPLAGLISASITAGEQLFAALRNGGTATDELQAALTALQNELTAVKQDTSADPAIVDNIAEVDRLVQAAITGFTKAEQGDDPAALPVPPAVD